MRAVSGYAANRRAELQFHATGEAPPDLVWAQQTLAAEFGAPPYRNVERYVPHDLPERNDPQEDWHWGNLSSSMASEVDHWIAHYVGDAKPGLLKSGWLDDQIVPVPDVAGPHPVIIHPRPIVEAILDEIIRNPTKVIGEMVGQSAANRSTPSLPPPVPCKPEPK
jgi:hypothetical protein